MQLQIQIPSFTFNLKSFDANETGSNVVQVKSWAKLASFGKQQEENLTQKLISRGRSSDFPYKNNRDIPDTISAYSQQHMS